MLTNGMIVGRLARSADLASVTDPAVAVTQVGNGRVNMQKALADTGTEEIQPAGVEGGGGPIVGPYRIAGNARLSGTVTDSVTSNPIIGATVSITCGGCNTGDQNVLLTTDASGKYSRTLNQQGPGFNQSVSVSVSKIGYATATWSGTISGNTTKDFALVIGKANATINVTPYGVTYDGEAHRRRARPRASGREPERAGLGGTTHTDAGDYPADAWTFTDARQLQRRQRHGQRQIAKANATIVVRPTVTYDGARTRPPVRPRASRARALSGLDLSGTTHTDAGTYGDAWTFTGRYRQLQRRQRHGGRRHRQGQCGDQCGHAVHGTYDGGAHGASGTATGVKGENLSGRSTWAARRFTNVRAWHRSWTFTGGTNYNDASGSGHRDHKANATIKVTPYSVTYDGNAHTATGTATGVKGESLSGLDLSGHDAHRRRDYPADPWTFTDVTGNYNDASGTVNDAIGKATAVITVTPYSVTYDGNAHTATGTATAWAREPERPGPGGTTLTNAGRYTGDAWTFTDANANYNDASGNGHVTHRQGRRHHQVTPYSVTYDGDAHTATGTATGVGGESLSGLDLSGTTHTNAGTTPATPGPSPT